MARRKSAKLYGTAWGVRNGWMCRRAAMAALYCGRDVVPLVFEFESYHFPFSGTMHSEVGCIRHLPLLMRLTLVPALLVVSVLIV